MMASSDGSVSPGTWREALAESVFRSSVPAKRIAEAMGISLSALYKACDEELGGDLAAKRLPALAATSDNYAALDYLEALAGRGAFRLPAANARCSVETISTIREVAEFLTAIADGVADGTLSAEDIARIKREGHDLMAAVSTVIAAAEAQAPRGDEQSGPSTVLRGGRS